MPVASDVASPTNGPRQLSDGNSEGTVLGIGGTLANGGKDKIAFLGNTPIAQFAQPATPSTATLTAGATTSVYVNSSFTGGTGTSGYTVGDIVTALKNYGLLSA